MRIKVNFQAGIRLISFISEIRVTLVYDFTILKFL